MNEAWLFNRSVLWHHIVVKSMWLIRLFFAWAVAASLVFAPLLAPANAQTMSKPAMAAMMGDMPCCPDEPGHDACKDCPYMALCLLKTFQAGPITSVTIGYAIGTPATISALNDTPAYSVAAPPPARPPRA